MLFISLYTIPLPHTDWDRDFNQCSATCNSNRDRDWFEVLSSDPSFKLPKSKSVEIWGRAWQLSPVSSFGRWWTQMSLRTAAAEWSLVWTAPSGQTLHSAPDSDIHNEREATGLTVMAKIWGMLLLLIINDSLTLGVYATILPQFGLCLCKAGCSKLLKNGYSQAQGQGHLSALFS